MPVQSCEGGETRGFRDAAQLLDQLRRGRGVVANQDHIAARIECSAPAIDDRPCPMRAYHAEVVTEDHPMKAELPPQNVLQPATGKSGGSRVYSRVDHVRRHDALSNRSTPAWANGIEVGSAEMSSRLRDRRRPCLQYACRRSAKPWPGKCLPDGCPSRPGRVRRRTPMRRDRCHGRPVRDGRRDLQSHRCVRDRGRAPARTLKSIAVGAKFEGQHTHRPPGRHRIGRRSWIGAP